MLSDGDEPGDTGGQTDEATEAGNESSYGDEPTEPAIPSANSQPPTVYSEYPSPISTPPLTWEEDDDWEPIPSPELARGSIPYPILPTPPWER